MSHSRPITIGGSSGGGGYGYYAPRNAGSDNVKVTIDCACCQDEKFVGPPGPPGEFDSPYG